MRRKSEMRQNVGLPSPAWVTPAAMLLFLLLTQSNAALCQERPYFVTYSQNMEEPGNLEVATKNAIGKPQDGNRFMGANMEFEYGVKAWWTSELYLDGATAAHDSTIFTGF